jgi:hypothetical protein
LRDETGRCVRDHVGECGFRGELRQRVANMNTYHGYCRIELAQSVIRNPSEEIYDSWGIDSPSTSSVMQRNSINNSGITNSAWANT